MTPRPDQTDKSDERQGRKADVTFSPEVCDAIIRKVSLGSTLTEACGLDGPHRSTVYAWRDRGRGEVGRRLEGFDPLASEDLFVDFVERLEAAEQSRVATWLEMADELARGKGAHRKRVVTTREVVCDSCKAACVEVTTSESEEDGRPDPQMARWLMERIGDKRFRRHDIHDVRGVAAAEIMPGLIRVFDEEARRQLPEEFRVPFMASVSARFLELASADADG